MITLYRKYHIAYWCIGITLIIGMVALMLAFWQDAWYFPLLVMFPTMILAVVNAIVFIRLSNKKLSREVLPLFYNCQVHKFIDEMNRLFAGKTKGPVVSLYNSMVARGYGVIDDYDSVCACCQKITNKAYKSEYHKAMIDYYLKHDQIDKAQNEMEELRKLAEQMKNPRYKEVSLLSIKNTEFYIRIKQGNYEGAEEHYLNALNTIKPLYPITQVSYSHALGKLLLLKGEPDRTAKYLRAAYNLGGDTKYKMYAEELLQKIGKDAAPSQ